MDMAKLTGKVAVVTGAAQGIGAAIAKALAAAGAQVVVADVNRAGADVVVEAIASTGGKALAVQGDVSKAADAQEFAAAAVREFGRLDVLVNNAGIWDMVPFMDVTEEQYRRVTDVNFLGFLLTTQAALQHIGEGGSIINISSNTTSMSPPNSTVYAGTKAAIEAITRVLANEVGSRQIRVNAILPGVTDTEGNRASGVIGSAVGDELLGRTPLGRIGRPEDIADVAVFLASDDSRWLTGERLLVSGGLR
jgi:3-oxoacyl-[acyl-carrier protein] reductase